MRLSHLLSCSMQDYFSCIEELPELDQALLSTGLPGKKGWRRQWCQGPKNFFLKNAAILSMMEICKEECSKGEVGVLMKSAKIPTLLFWLGNLHS